MNRIPDFGNDPLPEGLPELPPAREVQSPWLVCRAVRDGFSTVAFTASARDRTGLLAAVTRAAQEFDPDLAIEGHGFTVEDYGVMFLLLRRRAREQGKVEGLVERLNDLGTVPPLGWQIAVSRIGCLSVRAPDRSAVVPAVCSLLSEEQINVRGFDWNIEVRFPPGTDLLSASAAPPGEPIASLKFQLELPDDAARRLPDLRGKLARLAPESQVDFQV